MITYMVVLTFAFIGFEYFLYLFIKGWLILNKVPVDDYIHKRLQSNIKLKTWELHFIKEHLPRKLNSKIKKSLVKELNEYCDVSNFAASLYFLSLFFTVILLYGSVGSGSHHFGPIAGTLIALSVFRVFCLTSANILTGISSLFEFLIINRKKSFSLGKEDLEAEFGKELCQHIDCCTDESGPFSWENYIKSHVRIRKKHEEQLNIKLKKM